ncbi:MAG: zinc ABC transporter substrate-binding protein [Marmoricola sp.]|nr:zinc ABC transporter substrate-binding protein [Marmoricola sp.]
MWRVTVAGLALLLALPLSACSARPTRDEVVVSFYPLQFVAQRIVGSRFPVVDLAHPGVEPHDLELSPRQIATIASAKVAFYEQGLQPSVDDAIDQNRPAHVVDAASVVHLRPGDGGLDPHFWQDPTLLSRVSAAFAAAMEKADPAHAAEYRTRLASLLADLTALDREIRTGLAHCRVRSIVVSHDAFEYYGRRYGLDVHAIAGLSPDAEPSAQRLGQLADLARSLGITTVFSETLASPRLADTLASDAGLHTAVLDPIEGLSSRDPHADYLSLMRQNLRALQKAGGCT